MTSNKIVMYVIAALIPLVIIAAVLGVLLSGNEDNRDADAGLAIAQIPRIGRLRGFLTNDSTAIFYGIPFSQTTAGQFRWQKPRDPLPVQDDTITVDAFKTSKACPQFCIFPSPEISCPPIEDMSEDCLNLNVFVPSRLTVPEGSHRVLKLPEEKLTVMVYIYGGAFIAGANGIPLYDARYLAEKENIIVVNVNYRLGAFGFFYQDDGSETAALGNFGIYDQIKALHWVQRHIADFGGNPDQVTVFGQSAGAQSIAVLLLNEEADPLFHRAIMQSNPFGLPYKDIKAAQALGDSFARWARCTPNDLICLRALSMDEVLEAYKSLPYVMQLNAEAISEIFEPYSPILDGILLNNDPMFLFNQGKNQDKPILMGYVNDEGAMFVEEVFGNEIKNRRIYEFSANVLFGDYAESVLEMYPPECPRVGASSTDCDERLSMNVAVTDYMFLCPGRKAINSTLNRNKEYADVWFYTFNQTWSFPDFWEDYLICWDMVCHTEEVPYLFDIDKLTDYRFEAGEVALAQRMGKYWANFAKYGNPNGPLNDAYETFNSDGTLVSKKYSGRLIEENELLYWPRVFEPQPSDPSISYRVLQITAKGDQEIPEFRKSFCDFFDEMDYYLENYSIGKEKKSVAQMLYEVQSKTQKGEIS